MWKQTVGDWQERRQRRHGGPILDSPQAHLPEPVDTTESISRGFLPSGFHDRVPKSTYPASDGPETRPRPSQYTPLEQQTLGRFITSTWVVVSGVPADDILDVRDYFDAYVGCTVAHHLPLAASTQSEMYVQFASSLDAAQAVRTGVYSFNVEIGTAAAHPRSFAATNDIPARQLRSLELTVGWCRDLVFLESRERLRRQLLEAGPRNQRRAVLEPVSSVGKAPGTNELSGTPSPASPSLESSARGSDAAAATDGEDNNNAAAHPLLPRHRGRPSGSPSDSFSSTVTGPSSSRFAASASAQAGAAVSTNPSSPVPPPAWDLASNYPHSGAYHYAEQPFSDSHYSSLMRGGRQRSTVLSLFFHPCSCSPGAQWTIFFYVPVRFALLLLWTAWNAVSQLLSSPSAVLSHRRQPSLRQHNATHGDTAPAVPTQSLLPSPSQWRLRRSLRVGDVVPYAASPFEYISFLFYKYIPFAPEPQEVDVVLWSWLVLHSPRPQQSLRQLKQSVMVRQRPMNAMAGRFPTDNSLHVAATDLNQWGTQALGKTHRELPVLLAWRPAWWFTRYSPLSLFIMLVMFYYYY
ncbi:hypothetical protein JKF63_01061 [Porcisia hertigi]|uniref:RRM domain-containing protein n=1 Tax=Porcisia hertigi TaxID=2761500 RepID=A0A836I303_9TRYP|nr:hypothetical protein JKF63_01061 [Porcisia hertigi]